VRPPRELSDFFNLSRISRISASEINARVTSRRERAPDSAEFIRGQSSEPPPAFPNSSVSRRGARWVQRNVIGGTRGVPASSEARRIRSSRKELVNRAVPGDLLFPARRRPGLRQRWGFGVTGRHGGAFIPDAGGRPAGIDYGWR